MSVQVEIPNNIKDVARQPECPPAFIQRRRRRTVSGAEVLSKT